MGKLPQDIILAPIITEKSMNATGELRKYTFRVDKNAGKITRLVMPGMRVSDIWLRTHTLVLQKMDILVAFRHNLHPWDIAITR